MANRTHDSRPPSPTSEDLVGRLKAAANDAVPLREIIESNDSGTIAAAVAALLAGCSCSAPTGSMTRKKAFNRPLASTPNETIVEILLFADRDAIDALQLVCRFMLDFIQDREVEKLPLRPISRVNIGERLSEGSWNKYWIPRFNVMRDSNTGTELCLDTVHQLVPYIRLAYCYSFCIDLRRMIDDMASEKYRAVAYSAIFGDLVVQSTFVNAVTVYINDDGAYGALRAIETFKPLSQVIVKVDDGHSSVTSFNEAFFICAAERGVRSIKFESAQFIIGIRLLPALAFGMAEPKTGGDRSISRVQLIGPTGWDEVYDGDNFLEELVKKAGELDARQLIDFKFSIDELSRAIDPAGFEKYQKDKGTWVVNDLENGITMQVLEVDKSIQIHVFSSL